MAATKMADEVSSAEMLQALRKAMEEHQRAVEVLDCALTRVRVTEEALRLQVKQLQASDR